MTVTLPINARQKQAALLRSIFIIGLSIMLTFIFLSQGFYNLQALAVLLVIAAISLAINMLSYARLNKKQVLVTPSSITVTNGKQSQSCAFEHIKCIEKSSYSIDLLSAKDGSRLSLTANFTHFSTLVLWLIQHYKPCNIDGNEATQNAGISQEAIAELLSSLQATEDSRKATLFKNKWARSRSTGVDDAGGLLFFYGMPEDRLWESLETEAQEAGYSGGGDGGFDSGFDGGGDGGGGGD